MALTVTSNLGVFNASAKEAHRLTIRVVDYVDLSPTEHADEICSEGRTTRVRGDDEGGSRQHFQ